MKYALFLAVFSLSGCQQSLDSQHNKLESFVKRHQVGSSPDVYLIKHGLAGPERVALIYGFVPDSEFCFEIADIYTKKYPDSSYTCERAN